ncbi:Cytoplasmic dynein 1 heavy chain 1, partial [Geodia barretti]
MQPHYIYSPREMTRWVKGIYEALKPLETLSIEGLVRVWAHEALRLFQDRLIYDEERMWTDENIDMVAMKHFPNIDKQATLARPILYSNWLTKDYLPVNQEELRDYVQARLKVFYEEELDVPLVLFDEVLDHVLRIDRIFKQSQGHLLLIGVSGAGKTTLSRFVAWINGLSVFQVKVHRKYTAVDFDDDLRNVLRRSGCKGEKIVFVMDESNVLDSSFLERMNTLLANGEVPGLFEGDEYTTLMTQCKEGSQREGLMLDSAEELYKWFTQQVMRNLHVVFTMNPSSEGLKDRAATSPALFNRCVLNWFGDWSTGALYQVGYEFTNRVDLDRSDYMAPDMVPLAYPDLPRPPSHRQACVNAFVYVHQTLHQANARLAKRGGATMTLTPRHYLDFISHYVKLYNEKRSDLEEQQLHLNVGLQKIRETVDQVEELQASLSIKKNELEQKNALANQKLKQMVKDQQEAEKKKVVSQEIQEMLGVQNKDIAKKKKTVLGDLSKVEPAVKQAQQAVKSIKRQHLVEMRTLANPPKMIKMAMESICLLIGEPASDWKAIRSVLLRDNFITTIINFSTDSISDTVRDKMQRDYISDPMYTFESANHASKACGPLVLWAIAQVNNHPINWYCKQPSYQLGLWASGTVGYIAQVNNHPINWACGLWYSGAIAQLSYADMLLRVDPLRRELSALETKAHNTKVKGEEMTKIVQELEQSITRYKEEYAMLISEANAIKADLATVEAKVERSKALLASLADEKERWEAGSETFKSQMSTISGDVLLTSAFMAYGGYFDQQFRSSLFTSWASHLQQAHINFRPDLARVEYLSNADDRLKWQANALPTDDLCTENAIMIKRFNRYPLIVDPSGQATEFIMNEYRDRKITRTRCATGSYRFGTKQPDFVCAQRSVQPFSGRCLPEESRECSAIWDPLLVQDVESYDPILNPVLNREVRRTGGRVLITLGDQDIDLSPSFTIFLSTRDPSRAAILSSPVQVEFPPDLCSRVTFVNFTVTRGSLQSQCLNQVLKAERPDVDAKRSDLLSYKVCYICICMYLCQGEFHLRLRHLEQSLLQALNEVKGRILDDDRIIGQLENLKEGSCRHPEEGGGDRRHNGGGGAGLPAVSPSLNLLLLPLLHPRHTQSGLLHLELWGGLYLELMWVHFLYQFSLKFFLNIFQVVLSQNPNLKRITDYSQRLNTITTDMFQVHTRRGLTGISNTDLNIEHKQIGDVG